MTFKKSTKSYRNEEEINKEDIGGGRTGDDNSSKTWRDGNEQKGYTQRSESKWSREKNGGGYRERNEGGGEDVKVIRLTRLFETKSGKGFGVKLTGSYLDDFKSKVKDLEEGSYLYVNFNNPSISVLLFPD